jgi:hypothetical protein
MSQTTVLKNVFIQLFFLSGGGCLLEPHNDVGHLYLQHRSDCQNNLPFFFKLWTSDENIDGIRVHILKGNRFHGPLFGIGYIPIMQSAKIGKPLSATHQRSAKRVYNHKKVAILVVCSYGGRSGGEFESKYS